MPESLYHYIQAIFPQVTRSEFHAPGRALILLSVFCIKVVTHHIPVVLSPNKTLPSVSEEKGPVLFAKILSQTIILEIFEFTIFYTTPNKISSTQKQKYNENQSITSVWQLFCNIKDRG
ncbi:hypothetical protein HEL10_023660 [Escherichia coli]|nr:hypothetical protein [Escherichia coli]MBB8114991.1 hypothetical protein [Escherichia coli]